ncbi:MAG: HDOD domain-containing protein [Nitrospina sp.]|jgi:HD-like signal output (HDOD) protein|nr:HDOD domain-containing protein [Nitrospina sp.]MBT3876937.1 HDOD domain-containing protein [Nitrospina sp.]MBT4047935.1 HDOD domain-containing protein [Nitrospina sp.]MBT4558843.1 HDOD domain-containing protein [Nitrospina sp.]MBT5348363.1 HDOD domain-containing protein [Nitrospina sp.]
MISLTLDQFRLLKYLPSLPEQIDNVLIATRASSSMDYSIVEMIQYDPAMAMAVLKVANTPIYGYPGQISSLQQAAGLLGPGAIKNITLRIPILERFTDNLSEPLPLDYVQIWVHSGITAAISSGLSRLMGETESDVSFTSGLIHEAGTIALSVYFPAEFAKAQDFAEKNQVSLLEAEKQVLGFSHLEVAGEMMDAWGFPPQLSQIILQCAEPKKNNMNWELAGIVALAKSLASEWGFPSGIKNKTIEQKNLLALLGISEKGMGQWESELKKYAEFALNTMKIP